MKNMDLSPFLNITKNENQVYYRFSIIRPENSIMHSKILASILAAGSLPLTIGAQTHSHPRHKIAQKAADSAIDTSIEKTMAMQLLTREKEAIAIILKNNNGLQLNDKGLPKSLTMDQLKMLAGDKDGLRNTIKKYDPKLALKLTQVQYDDLLTLTGILNENLYINNTNGVVTVFMKNGNTWKNSGFCAPKDPLMTAEEAYANASAKPGDNGLIYDMKDRKDVSTVASR